jgi:hypothetical protein
LFWLHDFVSLLKSHDRLFLAADRHDHQIATIGLDAGRKSP